MDNELARFGVRHTIEINFVAERNKQDGEVPGRQSRSADQGSSSSTHVQRNEPMVSVQSALGPQRATAPMAHSLTCGGTKSVPVCVSPHAGEHRNQGVRWWETDVDAEVVGVRAVA
jgi:hypothetical protein